MSGRGLLRLMIGAITLIAVCNSAAADQHQRVVLLYDERIDLPGLDRLDQGIEAILSTSSDSPVEIYRETLDLSRFNSRDHLQQLGDYLALKYQNRKVDAVIAVMGPSLDFLLKNARRIFPGAAIVFCGIDRRELAGRVLPPDVTGVLLKREFAPTLEVALELHPNTERVIVVAGASEFDTRVLEQARSELERYASDVELTYLTTLPFPTLLEELSRLPSSSIVLYSTLFRDAAGDAFVPHEAIEQISSAASVPVYGFMDQYLGRGIVGGYLYGLNEHGLQAGRLARRVLAGEAPSSIPYIEEGASKMLFDARQLERWHIDEDSLPSHATVRFGEPTLWNEYKGYALAAIAAFALQFLFIVALIVEVSRRRQAEAQLRESERRFRSLADTAPVFIWMTGSDKRNEFVNQVWLAFTGRTLEQERGDGWHAHVHPDDLRRCLDTYHTAFEMREPFDVEFRVRRYDGEYRWILNRGKPRYSSLGAFLGYVGSAIDITERKRAEEALRTFEHAARLAMIGELSAMIAHEIKQPLAAILTNVSVAEMLLPSSQPRVRELREMIEDIRRDGLRANQTIDRVRAFARRQPMVLEPIDVRRVIEDVLSLAYHDAVRRGVRIEVATEPGLPLALADRICLQQVLLNLITNGLDAMQETPAELRKFSISAMLDGADNVRVAVTDRGSGVPPERLNAIFDSFVTTKKDGTGLGLAIARTIVESHRGRIWAENNAEGGATFYFTLCVANPTLREACASLASSEHAHSTSVRRGEIASTLAR